MTLFMQIPMRNRFLISLYLKKYEWNVKSAWQSDIKNAGFLTRIYFFYPNEQAFGNMIRKGSSFRSEQEDACWISMKNCGIKL